MEYNIQTVDVRETVNAVLQMVEPQILAKRLDSVADISPDVRVSADRDTLRQILLNLLSNAIKFTEHGGFVMVDVGYPLGMSDNVVMLRVSDSGCGIPRARMDEIFEPRVQPREPQSVSAGGIRHGLAISRGLARAMGGDLRVRSEEGQGAVFTLTLPRGE